MKLKKVILALCSVATLSMIGCNNGSEPAGNGNQEKEDENIIKVKMNNDTVMDKGSVSQLQTNSDGSITYNASAKYSGGDCLKTKEFTIRNRHSKIPIWDT